MSEARKRSRRGKPYYTGTVDVTSVLHVGGVQVRADRNYVEVRLANGTEIAIQTEEPTGFLVEPAAGEHVEIRPDDVPAESPPVVRTGPGGDFCRDWPEKKVRGERLEVGKTAAPGGSRSHLSPLTSNPAPEADHDQPARAY